MRPRSLLTPALHKRKETPDNSRMRPSEALATQRERILAIARASGASHVRVFGSALRGADRPDSDPDLLVDIPPGTSLLRIVGMKLAVEDALGVRVDLCTGRQLHPQLKERIHAEAAAMREGWRSKAGCVLHLIQRSMCRASARPSDCGE